MGCNSTEWMHFVRLGQLSWYIHHFEQRLFLCEEKIKIISLLAVFKYNINLGQTQLFYFMECWRYSWTTFLNAQTILSHLSLLFYLYPILPLIFFSILPPNTTILSLPSILPVHTMLYLLSFWFACTHHPIHIFSLHSTSTLHPTPNSPVFQLYSTGANHAIILLPSGIPVFTMVLLSFPFILLSQALCGFQDFFLCFPLVSENTCSLPLYCWVISPYSFVHVFTDCSSLSLLTPLQRIHLASIFLQLVDHSRRNICILMVYNA